MRRPLSCLALLAVAPLWLPGPAGAAAPIVLRSIHMTSPSSGWGLTAHSVLQTSDGGQHWTTALSSFGKGATLMTPVLSARGAQVAWVVVSAPAPNGSVPMTRVLSTTDGGHHWRRSAALRGYAAIGQAGTGAFTSADARHTWLLTSEGAAMESAAFDIYASSDGGVTWTRVSSGTPFHTKSSTVPTCDCLSAISFRNDSTGWLTGSFGVRPNYSILYRTSDGGRTWHNQVFSLPRGYRRDNLSTASPAFFGSDGLLPTLFFSPPAFVLYLTHDGGTNWAPTSPIPTKRSATQAPNAFALDANDVWAWVGHTLYRTSDAGRHWTILTAGLSLHGIPEMDFITPSIGFILSYEVGANRPPDFLKTTDGGHTWHRIAPQSASKPQWRGPNRNM